MTTGTFRTIADRRRHRRHLHRPGGRPTARSRRCRRPRTTRPRRSAPGSPSLAGDAGAELLAHGTTVATNALLERRGADGGAGDAPRASPTSSRSPARTGRRSTTTWADRPEPLVPRGPGGSRCAGRLDADGDRARAARPRRRSRRSRRGPTPVAVCLLHADLEPGPRAAVAAALRGRGPRRDAPRTRCRPSSASTSARSPPWSTPTCGPVCRAYLRGAGAARRRGAGDDLGRRAGPRSAAAAELPAALLLSGPAGGVRAGAGGRRRQRLPRRHHLRHGRHQHRRVPGARRRARAGGRAGGRRAPVRLPSLDVHTIGAGGGLDRRRRPGRRAGRRAPVSAARCPGRPATGAGGTEPTVTDADLVAGRIPAGAGFAALGGSTGRGARPPSSSGPRDRRRAAEGVIAVVDAAMERAAAGGVGRAGRRPAGLALVAFGGAGPLHACALADAPRHGGGGRPAPGRRAVGRRHPRGARSSTTWCGPGRRRRPRRPRRGAGRAGPGDRGRGWSPMPAAGSTTWSWCWPRLPLRRPEPRAAGRRLADFPERHRRRNGYARPGHPVEVVALRASARRASRTDPTKLRARERPSMTGPTVVVEADCTIWVPAAGGRARRRRRPRPDPGGPVTDEAPHRG